MRFTKLIILLLLSINIYAKNINFDNILIEAKNKNKQVMIFFYMKDCPWCHKMIKLSLEKQDIKDEINKYFLYESIDTQSFGYVIYKGEKISKMQFARKFLIYFYPSTLMFDNGKKVKHIKGYRNKNKFFNLIKYIGTKSYNKLSLKEFILNEDFNND